MVSRISLRFLGTSSAPNATRNYSSLLLNFDHRSVLVDCGEGTQRQLSSRQIGGDSKFGNLQSIFITHLHQDHVLGLVPLLTTLMGPGMAASANDKKPSVQIYGPCGLRALIRTTLTLCYTSLTGKYVVHELLWPGQTATPYEAEGSPILESVDPMVAAITPPPRTIPFLPAHEAELPGQDLRLHEESVSWPKFASIGGVVVSAAPILHRCPCIGYVFEEPASARPVAQAIVDRLDANGPALLEQQGIRHPRSLLGRLQRDREPITLPDGFVLEPPPLEIPGRKLTVLGDTFDASGGLNQDSGGLASGGYLAQGIVPLAMDSDVVVHECTNAAMPPELTQGRKVETKDEVRAKALTRGHSTPQVAGAFAGRIRARALLLNHFSVRYPSAPAGFQPASARVRVTLSQQGGSSSSSAALGSTADQGTAAFSAPNSNTAEESAATPAPTPKMSEPERRYRVMRCIEDQATETWLATLPAPVLQEVRASGTLTRAIATYDGFEYEIPSKRMPMETARPGSSASSSSSMKGNGASGDAHWRGSSRGSKRGGGRGRGRGGRGHGIRGRPSKASLRQEQA
ncbi:unnamed protein product [Tilletia controversa]|nr:unnamed protein product [Tilletia controversa]CAD6967551.1 unnamed protein product [Tilletia controversa]